MSSLKKFYESNFHLKISRIIPWEFRHKECREDIFKLLLHTSHGVINRYGDNADDAATTILIIVNCLREGLTHHLANTGDEEIHAIFPEFKDRIYIFPVVEIEGHKFPKTILTPEMSLGFKTEGSVGLSELLMKAKLTGPGSRKAARKIKDFVNEKI